MKKVLALLFLGISMFVTIGFGESGHAASIDRQNNIITSGRGVTSSMVSGRLFNQYKYKSGTGYVDISVITYFDRTSGTGPVKVKWVTVTYNNTSNLTPYFSEFFLDKRSGNPTYPTIPKEHKMMKKGSHSFTVTLNASNVQSVQLYAHSGAVSSTGGQGTRYQYITSFF